jgi:hypothetical protein
MKQEMKDFILKYLRWVFVLIMAVAMLESIIFPIYLAITFQSFWWLLILVITIPMLLVTIWRE